jgi:hypothetical protein
MLTVFAAAHTPRLTYVLNIVFGAGNYCVTASAEAYLAAELPALCYDVRYLGRGIHVPPCGLLEERQHRAFVPPLGATVDGLPILFPAPDTKLGFDVLGALFYVLSRYEEFGSKEVDAHGRYLPTASVLYRMGCMERPIADEWANLLCSHLQHMQCPRRGKILLTHDIDTPYRYRYRGVLLTSLLLLRDLVMRKRGEAVHRLKCVLRLMPDPYFNIETMVQADREAGFEPVLFLHCGRYGRYDRKHLIPSWSYRRLLRRLAREGVRLGLHPSYRAGSNTRRIGKERDRFAKQTGQMPALTRQHYLRFLVPSTPRALLDNGFTDDYSLGYSSCIGFRAGTCRPFPYFDLGFNVGTELMLHPLICMDVTLLRDRKCTPAQAKTEYLRLAKLCLHYGGEAVFLIHNSSLSEQDEWAGWDTSYKELLHDLRLLKTTYQS